MKKIKGFLLSILSLMTIVSLFSCTTNIAVGEDFDENAYNTALKNWNEKNYQNYTFTYGTNLNDALCYEFKGVVTVKNGVGSVTFVKANEDDVEIKAPEKNSAFYITSIVDLFDKIKTKHDLYEKDIEAGIYLSKNYRLVYNDTNFYPKIVDFSFNKTNETLDPGKSSDEIYKISILDFTLTE